MAVTSVQTYLLLAGLLLASTADAFAQSATSLDEKVGAVIIGASHSCFATTNKALKPGDVIGVVTFSNDTTRHLMRSTITRIGCPDDVSVDYVNHKSAVYTLDGLSPPKFYTAAIGVISSKLAPPSEPYRPFDVDGDGIVEDFNCCATGEGFQLTVDSGEKEKRIERWRDYAYVGYDLEPSCQNAKQDPAPHAKVPPQP